MLWVVSHGRMFHGRILIDVHLMDIHLMGVHFMGVCLVSMYLISYASHKRAYIRVRISHSTRWGAEWHAVW
jgi:hypothetical protein